MREKPKRNPASIGHDNRCGAGLPAKTQVEGPEKAKEKG